MKRFTPIYILVAFLGLESCVDQSPSSNSIANKPVEAENSNRLQNEKVKTIKNIFYSLPSPLELSSLFKQEGIVYKSEKLHQLEKREDYHLTHMKALNLGVYGADLSYAALFGVHEDAITYFSATQIIADQLGIGQTFRKKFVSRLEENANNKDTLLQVISDFFLTNEAYLKDSKQQDISTYVLLGGWIEGMYLGSQMIGDNSDTTGIHRIIASQKNSLNELLLMIDEIEQKPQEIQKLGTSLQALKAIYQDVVAFKQVNHSELANSKMKNEKKISDSKVELNPLALKAIKLEIEKARALIIQ